MIDVGSERLEGAPINEEKIIWEQYFSHGARKNNIGEVFTGALLDIDGICEEG